MTLKSTAELLVSPLVAANVVMLEQAEAVVEAAEAVGHPVLLQVSENAVAYHGDLAHFGRALLSIAAASSADVGVHLDHATQESLVEEAVQLGFQSVMFDGSQVGPEENMERTAAVAARYQPLGVWIEGEIGEIGGKRGAHDAGVLTSVSDAREFAQRTGVDGLAVAVGSSHHMTQRTANLDLERIADLARAVSVPLVLHGSSGVSFSALKAAVRAGIRKINVGTHFNRAFTDGIRSALESNPELVDPRELMSVGRDQVRMEAMDFLVAVATATSQPATGESA